MKRNETTTRGQARKGDRPREGAGAERRRPASEAKQATLWEICELMDKNRIEPERNGQPEAMERRPKDLIKRPGGRTRHGPWRQPTSHVPPQLVGSGSRFRDNTHGDSEPQRRLVDESE